MSSLLKKLQGRNPAAEKKIKEQADIAAAEYEKAYGKPVEEAGIVEDEFLPNTESSYQEKGWKLGMAPSGGAKPSKLSKVKMPSLLDRAEAIADQWRKLSKERQIGYGAGGRVSGATQEKAIANKIADLQKKEIDLRTRGIYQEAPDLVKRAKELNMTDDEIRAGIAQAGNSPDDFSMYLDSIAEWNK